jgi:hypothetical protein
MYKSTTNLMENTMFKFEDQYKKFDEILDHTQSMYEFWTKAVFTTIKDIFNTTKTK